MPDRQRGVLVGVTSQVLAHEGVPRHRPHGAQHALVVPLAPALNNGLDLGVFQRQTLERLRMLRRWGILRNSKQTFEVSRTGKPSLALRYVARVLSMNRFQFRRLLAADAYERGERDDQEGAYSDEEDEDDDGFGDYKPLTVEQVWNGDTVLTGETPDSSRLLDRKSTRLNSSHSSVSRMPSSA